MSRFPGSSWIFRNRVGRLVGSRAGKRQLYQAEAVHTTAARQREAFELEHPVKARMGVGQIVELRAAEERTKESLEKAKSAWRAVWDDP